MFLLNNNKITIKIYLLLKLKKIFLFIDNKNCLNFKNLIN